MSQDVRIHGYFLNPQGAREQKGLRNTYLDNFCEIRCIGNAIRGHCDPILVKFRQ